jgi:type IV pilus assembly protein PilV
MNNSRMTARPRGLQRGSTMIEVMVSVVIVALGMMGMLGMFVNSLKITSGALYRNIATQHAYMIADTMRASAANLTSYYSSPAATATASCFTLAGCPSNVTPTNISNTEYAVWETQLSNLLPAGQGAICQDSSPGTRSSATPSQYFICSNSGPIVIKVCWDETRISNNNASISNASNASSGGGQCTYTNL